MKEIFQILTSEGFVALLSLIGGIGTAFFSYLSKRRKKLLEKQVALNTLLTDVVYRNKIQAVKEMFDIQTFGLLHSHVQTLWDISGHDRFTIMFLMNGNVDFRYLTVLYDESNLKRMPSLSPYSRFPIGTAYQDMVKRLEVEGFITMNGDFKVGKMADFIQLEQIQSITWAFVKRIAVDNDNTLFVYCSYSSENKVSAAEQNLANLHFRGRILNDLLSILDVPDVDDGHILEKIKSKREK